MNGMLFTIIDIFKDEDQIASKPALELRFKSDRSELISSVFGC